MIAYRATLDVPRELVQFTAKLLLAERRRCRTPRGSRALTCFWQAVVALRWFRDRTAPDALARDHGISRATAYRYIDEVTTILAQQAPGLAEVLERARDEGFPHVILDGKIIPCDRCEEPAISVKGEVIDLWYSGKAHTHGGSIQAVLAPGGFPLWIACRAWLGARPHRRPPPRLACPLPGGRGRPAHPGYDGAGIGIHIPSNSPLTGGNWTSATAPATPSSDPCAAWANAGSPCSTSAGAPFSTSPPAPAKSTTLPAPPPVLTQFEHGYIT